MTDNKHHIFGVPIAVKFSLDSNIAFWHSNDQKFLLILFWLIQIYMLANKITFFVNSFYDSNLVLKQNQMYSKTNFCLW
jgi:hypothetical protein